MALTVIDKGYCYEFSNEIESHPGDVIVQKLQIRKTERPENEGDICPEIEAGAREEEVVLMLCDRARHMNENWPVAPDCIEYEYHLNKALESLMRRKEDRAERGVLGKLGE